MPDPPALPEWPPPPEPVGWWTKAWPIARDVLIIFALTFAGGFVAGFAYYILLHQGVIKPMPPMLLPAITNLLMAPIGFTISGCLAPPDRWRHLRWVALWVWLLSAVNLLFGVSISQWFTSAIATMVFMGIGGGLSLLFKRNPPPPEPFVREP